MKGSVSILFCMVRIVMIVHDTYGLPGTGEAFLFSFYNPRGTEEGS
ncbi:hypothetical protein [Paenibacillus xylanilyticus]|uniref:Uncharacterized protein n=1 Tax=Paenibacillus xylanilyticus TaxID=248903 RepID=A0A7Y6BZZ9_9BACL|nr:hypothetical protein [Paenibacillus xylanilyticus]NUU78088.1 hypothetical protein [Paenibacillus xylanilyticus]